jgi:phosphoribosylamine--glycine ligase
MLTASGPKVIEFNVRFGDPEAQVVLPRVSSDLFDLFVEAARGDLVSTPEFLDEAAVTIVLAAADYPGSPKTGMAISGLDGNGQLADPLPGVTVFHAGTARPDPEGPYVVNGGRVLTVTALGGSLAAARELAYKAAETISFDGMQMRGDIAAVAAGQEQR